MKLKALLAAVLLALSPVAALAVPIPVGIDDFKTGSNTLDSGSPSWIVEFVATDPMIVAGTASGSARTGADLEKVMFGLTLVSDLTLATSKFAKPFLTNPGPPQTVSGDGLLNGPIEVAKGGSFFVLFDSAGLVNPVSVTYAITTAAVPLPAAGWMLISAMAGMGILARRRKSLA
jgi:hypothetical protein